MNKMDLIEHIVGRLSQGDQYVLIDEGDKEEMAAVRELVAAELIVKRPSNLDSDGYMEYVLKKDE